MQGVATVIQTMLSKNASLVPDINIPDMGDVLTKIFNVSLPDCNLEDMIKQWTAAIAIKLPLPKLVVPELNVTALQALIPGFKVPSLVIPGTAGGGDSGLLPMQESGDLQVWRLHALSCACHTWLRYRVPYIVTA